MCFISILLLQSAMMIRTQLVRKLRRLPTIESIALAELRSVNLGYALGTLMQHGAPWVLAAPDRHLPRLRSLCLQSQCYALHLGSIVRTHPDQVAAILHFATTP
jgi:hypothetical protein